MPIRFRPAVATLFASFAFGFAPAHALPFSELHADQLLAGADSIRAGLALTPNQQSLWQQSVAKAQAILRARAPRREKLQVEFKARLAGNAVELRELAASLDGDSSAGAAEERQLRELWLAVNDALTDAQRAQVAALLLSQLERVEAEPGRGMGGPGGRERGPGGARGQRGGTGGMGGPGGGRGGMPGMGD